MFSVVVTGTVHVPASVFTYLFSSVLFMFNSHLNRDCDPATVEIKMKVWQQVPSRKSRVHGWYETFARCPLVLKVRVWLWPCSDGSNACCSWMWKANVDAVFSDASEFIHRSLEICGPFLQSSSLFWLFERSYHQPSPEEERAALISLLQLSVWICFVALWNLDMEASRAVQLTDYAQHANLHMHWASQEKIFFYVNFSTLINMKDVFRDAAVLLRQQYFILRKKLSL